MPDDLKDIALVYDPIIQVRTEDGALIVRGEAMSPEEYGAFSASLKGYRDSYARTVIRDQLKWLAINQGIHSCQSNEQLLFAKAALWLINQEEKLINSI